MPKKFQIYARSIFLSAVSAGFFTVQMAQAQLSNTESDQLKNMELKLFFKSYDDLEKPEQRLARIEKRIFGDAGEGNPSERISKLAAIVKPDEKKPDDVKAKNNNQQNNRPQQQQQPQQPTQQQQDYAQEDAQEAARRRARQAKEEEVSQLQAEAVELWKARRGQEALDKFEQVLRLAPDYAEAHFSLGVIYEAKQDYVEALASYKRALELSPQRKDYREAVALLDKKAKTQEVDQGQKAELKALAGQASAAYQRGEYQSALELYKDLDKRAPKEALVKFNIGTIYLALKNPVDALDYFKQALKLKPDEPRYQDAVQRLGANLGREQQNRMASEQAWNQQEGANNNNNNGRGKKNQKQQNNQQQFSQNQNYENSNNQQQQFNPNQNQQQPNNANQNPGLFGQGNNLNNRGNTPPSAAFGILARGNNDGVEITAIGVGSRASRAGLMKGDIIRAVDGVVTNSMNDLNQVFGRKQPNEGVQLIIQRGGKIGQFVL